MTLQRSNENNTFCDNSNYLFSFPRKTPECIIFGYVHFSILFRCFVLAMCVMFSKKKYAKKRFRENLALPSSMHLPFRSLTKNAPNINTYTFNYIHNTLPYFSRKTNITNNNNPCLSQTRTSKSILYINFQIEFSTTRRYRFFLSVNQNQTEKNT